MTPSRYAQPWTCVTDDAGRRYHQTATGYPIYGLTLLAHNGHLVCPDGRYPNLVTDFNKAADEEANR